MQDIRLGIEAIDETHNDFFDLLHKVETSSDEVFSESFLRLLEHTKEHFAFEEALMRNYQYYGLQEHIQEHKDLLGEMEYFYSKAQKSPSFGRAYIKEYAYDKFKRHITNIDSQLAMFLKHETS